MRRGMANLRRLGRSVNAVMLLRQIDPHGADWTIRPWRDTCLGVFRIRVPKQFRVVVEDRHLLYDGYLPCADGQRIMLAAACNGGVEQHLAVGVLNRCRAGCLGDIYD